MSCLAQNEEEINLRLFEAFVFNISLSHHLWCFLIVSRAAPAQRVLCCLMAHPGKLLEYLQR